MVASLVKQRRDFGRIGILAGSAALHVSVFGWLGVTAVERLGHVEPEPPFVIEMMARRPASRETVHDPVLAELAPTAAASEPGRTTATPQPPSPPAPRVAAASSLAPTVPPGPPVTADNAAISRALRNSALACRLGRSDLSDQARCDQALAEAARRASPIQGTGHAQRDARFAAQGAEALARYENLRKPLKPYSRAEPCPGSPNPSDPCAFGIQGRIWSSQDGWLPDLPRPH